MPEKANPEDKIYKEYKHEFYDDFEEKDVKVAYRFSRPTSAAAGRAQKEMQKAPSRGLNNLCMSCMHPDDKPRFNEELKKYPGLSSTFGGALLKASGFAELGN